MSTRRHIAWRLMVIPLLLAASLLQARDTGDPVQAFFADLQTLRADFHQEVIDSDQQMQQVSDGQVWIQRPGKFRWNYETPYRQQLVADGKRLWSYDEDLAQVTVQPMDQVFSSTPAMLLSGNEPLDKVFVLQTLPADDGLARVHLKPRSDDSSVTGIDLYFEQQVLSRLEARDSFGNTTVFEFTGVERNAVLDHTLFRFTPPPDADIVGDTD